MTTLRQWTGTSWAPVGTDSASAITAAQNAINIFASTDQVFSGQINAEGGLQVDGIDVATVPTTKFLPAMDGWKTVGAPTQGVIQDRPCWLMPNTVSGSADTAVGFMVDEIPAGWTTYNVYLMMGNTLAVAGNTRLRCDILNSADVETMAVPSGGTAFNGVWNGTQFQKQALLVPSGPFSLVSGDGLCINVRRISTDTTDDTLIGATGVALMGVRLVQAS